MAVVDEVDAGVATTVVASFCVAFGADHDGVGVTIASDSGERRDVIEAFYDLIRERGATTAECGCPGSGEFLFEFLPDAAGIVGRNPLDVRFENRYGVDPPSALGGPVGDPLARRQ